MRLNAQLADIIKNNCTEGDSTALRLVREKITGLMEPVLAKEGEGFGLRVSCSNVGDDLLVDVAIRFP